MTVSTPPVGRKHRRTVPVPLSQLPADLWTVEHVALYLGKSQDWVYRRTAEGVLPVHKIGAANRYLPGEIVAWVAAIPKQGR